MSAKLGLHATDSGSNPQQGLPLPRQPLYGTTAAGGYLDEAPAKLLPSAGPG